jgi:hypothetical protein
MDLRVYYQRLRQLEASITEPHVVVVSLGTPDGGSAGVLTEVPRTLAAKLVVEGGARLASEDETSAFRAEAIEAQRRAEESAAAGRIQVTVVSASREEARKQKLKGKTPQE